MTQATNEQTKDVEVKPQVQDSSKEQPKRKPVLVSQPFYSSKLTINSSQAHRVMNRSFKRLAGSLFRSDVIIRIIQDDNAADSLETVIQDLLTPVATDLQKAIEQSRVLIEQNNITQMPSYTTPKTFEIEIKSPQIGVFAKIVAELDRLMMCIDALWMNGVINNKQRSYQTYEWQQRLIKLSNRIIDFERRARKRADELGKNDEVNEHVPEEDDDDDSQEENSEQQEAVA